MDKRASHGEPSIRSDTCIYKHDHIYLLPTCVNLHWYLSVVITPSEKDSNPIMLYILDGFGANRDSLYSESKQVSSMLEEYVYSLRGVPRCNFKCGTAETFLVQDDDWSCGYFIAGWLMKFAEHPELLYKSPLTIILQQSFVEDTRKMLIEVFRELAASGTTLDEQEQQTYSNDAVEDTDQHQTTKKAKQRALQQPQVKKKRKREDDEAKGKEDNNGGDVQELISSSQTSSQDVPTAKAPARRYKQRKVVHGQSSQALDEPSKLKQSSDTSRKSARAKKDNPRYTDDRFVSK
jgi:hypothetical protein